VLPCEELDELRTAIAQYQAKGGSR
jgi:hypothetical protein